MTEREDRLALADKIEGAFGFVGFETEKRKFMHRPVEISEEEQATIVAVLRLSPVMGGSREEIAWDHNSNRSYEPVELLAAEFYKQFEYNESGKKPDWLPGGNSLKQDEARFKARQQLRALGHVSITALASHPQARGEEVRATILSDGERTALEKIRDICEVGGPRDIYNIAVATLSREALRPSEATAGREALRYRIGGYIDAIRLGASNEGVTNAILRDIDRFAELTESLPASRNGVDTDGADTDPVERGQAFTARQRGDAT